MTVLFTKYPVSGSCGVSISEVLGMTLINMNKMYLTLSHSGRWITYLSYHPYDLMILVIILLMALF